MAAPMRSSAQDPGHRARVADPRTTTAKASDTQQASSNFEYDDNEWDVGIGNLIIDLDADIEKTNEVVAPGGGAMAATNPGAAAAAIAKNAAKLAIEHSATVDKGLKMKIKRTKPGTKTSEAKHEIVKSNEQNGGEANDGKGGGGNKQTTLGGIATAAGKRGSSGHRRDKAREKVADKPGAAAGGKATTAAPGASSEVNGVVRVAGPQRPIFPSGTCPGPPAAVGGCQQQPPSSPAAAVKLEPAEDGCPSPPPAKKLKTDVKDVTDVCIGTSVGTITEPDCLGPCEPGTSVTLEGIVWHETEGGVLVVNVTWRGKTYVGTLLDCTRHDWAPPRFCDSPTSDLDSRTPKGRGKRGRAAAAAAAPSPSTDLSNFTETRSSVHSKLRNGATVKGRRGGGGGGNGSGSSTAPSSPTPFVPPRPEPNNKRKNRTEDESPATPPIAPSTTQTAVAVLTTTPSAVSASKKQKTTPTQTSSSSGGSPPPSPILLECPEPNCSKKYKHINGLKYHQSHAHGSVADDEDTKDVTSMSENDESNIEAPSPATPIKSPDKSQDSPMTPQKKEDVKEGGSSRPATPPSPETPSLDLNNSEESSSAPVEVKSIVKPSVLLYNTAPEEFPLGVFSGGSKTHNLTGPSPSTLTGVRAVTVSIPPEQPLLQIDQPPLSFVNQLPQPFAQPPTLLIPAQPAHLSPTGDESPTKIAQFKVKPASALMPDDKKDRTNKLTGFKKKKNKMSSSPGGSPLPLQQHEMVVFGVDVANRDEVQSPAYSDISDDGTPIEPESNDKTKTKKTDGGAAVSHLPQYGMYPFYGQTPFVKEPADKLAEKVADKDVINKKEPEYPAKMLQQHYYNPYGYMPNYAYNVEANFNPIPLVDDKKDEPQSQRIKESPGPAESAKPPPPIPNPIQVPTPGKSKPPDLSHKEKQQAENHQILKESIEIKSQMGPYVYGRTGQPQQPPDDLRRFYVYPERRKEPSDKTTTTPAKLPPPAPSLKPPKEKVDDKKEKEIKHEGVKPTMETQGPPPPPTSQYAYIHPSYMQSPHYGALPFDPNHPVYRGLMVPGPYSGNPYLHPQMPRYHAPEDLSRPPPPTKALDMLQHHAQYYSSHKIHELQERAIKSPTPKTSIASSSPSSNGGPPIGQQPSQMSGCVTTSQAGGAISAGGKQTPGDGKDSRSPPPQRHVHTHHHTHVGLGYPMYPAPFGAAVLASQQAAAVTVINPYPPK